MSLTPSRSGGMTVTLCGRSAAGSALAMALTSPAAALRTEEEDASASAPANDGTSASTYLTIRSGHCACA